MSRAVHKSTDQLPPEAHRVMAAGFLQNLTVKAIAARLADIGLNVPERTIARRGAEWRAEQARVQSAREYVHHLVDAMKDQPDGSAILQALAVDQLLSDPDAWAKQDPMKVQSQNLVAEELRLKREKLDVQKQRLELDRQRFRTMQEREQRAIKTTDELKAKTERGEKLTPEDIDRIREVYGLNR
jgi:hypothetical protein